MAEVAEQKPAPASYKDTFLYRSFGLCEPMSPDPDGTYEGLICPPDQARMCWYISWLTLASVAVALYYRHYDLAALAVIGLITSLLYWHAPTYSWRRNLDIIVVQICLWWHVHRAMNAENKIPYFILVGIGGLAFMAGWVLFSMGSTWAGTLAHLLVHIMANVSNISLYIGHIGPSPLLAKAAALFAV
jgi:hypothetical protein